MNTNLNPLLREYKKLEMLAHVWVDEIMHKVTQEVWELIEAHLSWDNDNTYWEASDVIVNILSVAEELWLEIWDFDRTNQKAENTELNTLSVLHWKWNQKVQWLRNRYSRENIWVDEATSVTKELVKEVLNYADPEIDLNQIVEKNTKKFRSRVWEYKPDIDIKDYIANYPGFPKKWINFKDISPILKSPEAFRYVCMELARFCSDSDVIVWLDSRWFLFWTWIAEYLWKPFVMVRKAWKLPWETTSQDYWLEYWNDVIQIQNWSIEAWQKVSIIDDLLATWWTAKAAIDLVEKLGWTVDNVSFVISLDEDWLNSLDSRKQLWNYKLNSVVSYS